jgi:hypothetical protein
MKIAFNETQTTIILNGGRLELWPRGAQGQRDRRQIDDAVAELPDVKRFKDLGKISVLTLEETAKRDRDAKQVVATAAADGAAKAARKAEKAAAEVPVASPKVEAPPAPVEPPAPADEPVVTEPNDESAEDDGRRKSKRSRHH